MLAQEASDVGALPLAAGITVTRYNLQSISGPRIIGRFLVHRAVLANVERRHLVQLKFETNFLL